MRGWDGMKASAMVSAKRAAGLGAMVASVLAGPALAAPELVGQPTPGGFGMQPSVTAIGDAQHFFHNGVLMPIITFISLFVLGLLLYVAVRFNRRANPVAARFTHNTSIEVLWTVVPVLILMFIAIFSFRLLFAYHDTPRIDYTIKATGYQWYWGYEYPDQEIGEITSIMLPEDEAKAQGRPHQLAVDNPIVVPVNKNVQILVTAADVIHAFALPAFGVKADAVPGRVNEVWFNARRIGTYYGQCSELCGVDHAYMPIEIRVVSQADFDRWVGTQRVAAGLPATIQPASAVTAPAGAAAVPAGSGAPVAETPSPAAPGLPTNPALPGTSPEPSVPAGQDAAPEVPTSQPQAVPANQTTRATSGSQLAALSR